MQFTSFIPHWFDLLTLVCLGAGWFFGRKRGMSEELLPVGQWVVIVIACAYGSRLLGLPLAKWAKIEPATAYAVVYLGLAIGIKILFNGIKRMTGEKLAGRDTFGRAEYYLGMIAGMTRAGCMLLMALAFLHAKQYSAAEVERVRKLQKENFGDISFPTLGSIQQQVFQRSIVGSWVKANLNQLLIVTGSEKGGGEDEDNIGKRRANEVEQIISPR